MAYSSEDHTERNFIFAATWYDNIGMSFGWLDKLIEHRLDGRKILLDDGFDRASSFVDISGQSADKANIVVGLDKNFDVHQIHQRLVLKNEQALDNNHWSWLDEDGLVRSGIGDKRIFWSLNFFVLLQERKMLDHQIGVECVGMVVVERESFFKGNISIVFVIKIMRENDRVGNGQI